MEKNHIKNNIMNYQMRLSLSQGLDSHIIMCGDS